MRKDDFLKTLQTLENQFLRLAKQLTESPVVITNISRGQLTDIKNYVIQRSEEIKAISNFYKTYDIIEPFSSDTKSLDIYTSQTPEKIIELLEKNFALFKKILQINYSVLVKKFHETAIKQALDKKEEAFLKKTDHANFTTPRFCGFEILETLSLDETAEWLKCVNFSFMTVKTIDIYQQNLNTYRANQETFKIFSMFVEDLDDYLQETILLHQRLDTLLTKDVLSQEFAKLIASCAKLIASIEDNLIKLANTTELMNNSIDWYQNKLTSAERRKLTLLKRDMEIKTEDPSQDDFLMNLPHTINLLHHELNNHPIKETTVRMLETFKQKEIDFYEVFEKAHEHQNFLSFKTYAETQTKDFLNQKKTLLLAAEALFAMSKLFAGNSRFFAAVEKKLTAHQTAETITNNRN